MSLLAGFWRFLNTDVREIPWGEVTEQEIGIIEMTKELAETLDADYGIELEISAKNAQKQLFKFKRCWILQRKIFDFLSTYGEVIGDL